MRLFVILLVFGVLTAVPRGAAEDPFTISTSYQNLLSNESGMGLLDRVLTEAFTRIGREARFVYTPTAQSLVDVNAGVFDGEINRIAGMEEHYPNLVRVPEPNMTMRFVAFAIREYEIADWESIRPLHIGIVRGWKILETATEGFPSVTFVPTEKELFDMLRLHRIDVALYSLLTGVEYVAERGPAYGEIRPLEPPLASREMYLYVHRSHAALAVDIAEALREMKMDGTYNRILSDTTAGFDGYGD